MLHPGTSTELPTHSWNRLSLADQTLRPWPHFSSFCSVFSFNPSKEARIGVSIYLISINSCGNTSLHLFWWIFLWTFFLTNMCYLVDGSAGLPSGQHAPTSTLSGIILILDSDSLQKLSEVQNQIPVQTLCCESPKAWNTTHLTHFYLPLVFSASLNSMASTHILSLYIA